MYSAIVFLPLLGFLIAGLFGRRIGDRPSEIVTTALLFVSCFLSWVTFIRVGFNDGHFSAPVLANWMTSGALHVDWALRVDTLTAVMLVVVTTVSSLVHLYSIGYMHEDPARPRFFAYLSLFTFAMLMLVTADNLAQMFFGWEGVGLASYLLIGFWYEKPSANAAAIKAFVVNRVGDFGFALGIFLVFVLTKSISFDAVFAAAPGLAGKSMHIFGADWDAMTLTCLLLFMGAMGKSAQFLLHTWLPDAMEGPTPVSALIHAATMVTAGVFLVARMSPLFNLAPGALAMVAVVGGSTAFFAATIGCVQNDIKRVIAYSTCSQLGYMFLGEGVAAYPASIFHLLTHAFFKALLFLAAGSVIHAMSDEQDMRKMGGLWRKIPITYVTMWAGSLALAGVFPFAGYFSKDAILDAALSSHSAVGYYGYVMGILAAVMTAFYSWRLLLMTFHGAPRGDHHAMEHAHESPLVMTGPLMVLSVGALCAGFLLHGVVLGEHWQEYWRGSLMIAPANHIMTTMEQLPGWAVALPSVAGLLGIAVAYWFYWWNPMLPVRLATQFRPVYLFLLNKWYFDELYDAIFVRPAFALGRLLWQTGDATIIDGVPNGLADLAVDGSRGAVKIQTGSIAVYAFVMLIGVVALIGVFLIWG